MTGATPWVGDQVRDSVTGRHATRAQSKSLRTGRDRGDEPMSARHRRPQLPESDGLFAGIALAAVNVLGFGLMVYGAGTTSAAPPISAPDVPPTDEQAAGQQPVRTNTPARACRCGDHTEAGPEEAAPAHASHDQEGVTT